MGHKKIMSKKRQRIKNDIYKFLGLSIIIFFAVFLALVALKTPITGAFAAGGSEWENSAELIADNSVQTLIQHIVFGQNKPASCSDGIYVEANSQQIAFTTTNEIYADGLCAETDIVFDNIIYKSESESAPEQNIPITGFAAGENQITYYIYYGKIVAQEEKSPDITVFAPILGGGWWNSGWTYRQNITITNNEVFDLTDFQVNLTIDTATLIAGGKMNSSCYDIRFVNSTNSQIDYWIETGTCDSALTKIWIKVPNIPASGDETIAMYYGNPGAAAGANGDNTFLFFDDFDNPSDAINTTKWNVVVDGGSGTVSSSILNEYGSDNYHSIRSNINFTANVTIEGSINVQYVGVDRDRMAVSGTGIDYGIFATGVDDLQIYFSGWTSQFPPQNTWLRMQQKIDDVGLTYSLTAGEFSYTNTQAYSPPESFEYSQSVGDGAGSNSGNLTTDWIFARKLTANEPSLTEGSEEILTTDLPVVNNFPSSYGSTNFSAVSDITNVTNLTLANQYGLIQFPEDYGVNAKSENYDANINMGNGFISVNIAALNSTFNHTARLTIYNADCANNIYYAAGTFTNKQNILAQQNICNDTTDPSCIGIICTDGNISFDVSHFTGFAVGVFANLIIWDETDPEGGSQTKYANDQVRFFANYTNATSQITGATCMASFTDSVDNAMQYNDTTTYYEYNRSFGSAGIHPWNATCNMTGYDTLTAYDNVTISSTATPITNCTNINSSGTYILQNNISGYQGSNKCFDIQSDNVIIDCNGKSIIADNAPGTYAVYIEGYNNFTIENCNIRSYRYGIYGRGSNYTNIKSNNVNINSALSEPIYCQYCEYLQVISNNASSGDIGIDIEEGHNPVIQSNYIHDNGWDGLIVNDCTNSTVSSNTIENNDHYGLYMLNGPESIVSGNTIENNANDGFYMTACDNITITSNVVNGNANDGGIILYNTVNVTAINNTANNNNDWAGFNIWNCYESNFWDNTASNNIGLGFDIEGVDDSTLTRNTASSNGDLDIYLYRSSNNIFINQTLASYSTTFSFTYDGDIGLRGVTNPPNDPSNYYNISKYINATTTLPGSWIAVNISYMPADLNGVDENTLFIARYNDTWENDTSVFANNFGVDTVNNVVYANITGFGSIFAPLGNTSPVGSTYSPVAGFNFTLENTNIDVTADIQYGIKNVIAKYNGVSVGRFVTDFPSNGTISVAGLTANASITDRKSVVYKSGAYPAEITSKDLLVPTNGFVNKISLCPNAQTLADITSTCAGKFDISVGETRNGVTLTTTTISGQDYYVAQNVTGTGGIESYDWSMFGHDTRHTGYTTVAGPTTANLIWNHTADSVIYSSPAIMNGIVYIGEGVGIYALNATNGITIWNNSVSISHSSPAVVGDVLYIGGADNKTYAFNATNGNEIWNYTAACDCNIESSPTVVNGIVYAAARDGIVFALNTTNGNKIWNYTIESATIANSPAVANGIVYVGDWLVKKIYAINATDGSLIWNYTAGESITWSSPSAVNDIVYIGADYLYALNATNGSLVWRYNVSYTENSPAVANGIVYISSSNAWHNDTTYALNASTGAHIWNHTTNSPIYSSPMVSSNGIVYIGYGDNNIYALNATNGSKIWNYTLQGVMSLTSAALAKVGNNDILVVNSLNSTGNAMVYAFGQEEVGSLYSNATGFNFTLESDSSVDVTQTPEYGIKNVIAKYNGVPVGRFVTDFPANGTIDVSGLTADVSVPNRKAVLYRSSWPAEIIKKDIFVPTASNNLGAFVCPNAQTLADVNRSCLGGYATATDEITTVNGADYVTVKGVTGTGSESENYWTMFRHDLRHTGFNNVSGPVNAYVIWNYTTGLYVESSPAVVGDVVYVGSDDTRLYALNATTGTHLWNYSLGSFYAYSSPAVANGIVYSGVDDYRMTAVNATNGSLIWSNYLCLGCGVRSSPAVKNGRVYFGTGTNFWVYALNATDGNEIWHYATGMQVQSSPAVTDDIVYVGSADNNIYALNATNGSLIWSYATGNGVYSSPAVVGDMVYVGSADKNVYALNATNGSQIWNYTTGDTGRSSPAIANGIVYVGSYDNKTYALNASTGAHIWNYTANDGIESSPAVSGNGIVYIGSNDGTLYALNATNGSLIWNYTLASGYFDSSPSLGPDGKIYIGSTNGKVYAFGPSPYLISNCVNITIPGYYTLIQDILNSGATVCINISASNVTFDGQGHVIDGIDASSTGILAELNIHNVTVKNVTVSDWEYGVRYNRVSNGRIEFVNANSSAMDGIRLNYNNNTAIINNTAKNNENNGIYVQYSSNSTFSGNTFNDNYAVGLDLTRSPNSALTNNTFDNNKDVGVYLYYSPGISVAGNTLNNNTYQNIYITHSANSTFTNNQFNDNKLIADGSVYVDYSDNCVFANNTVNNNDGYAGILLSRSNNLTFTNNTINNNRDIGIYVYACSNNTFINNVAQNNTLWDYYSESGAINNHVTNLTIGSLISFESEAVAIKNASSPAADPVNYQNITKYVNATNTSANSWLFLNISYSDSDVAGLDESGLAMARYSGTWETHTAAFANRYGVNTVANYVYANITGFGSIFAPLFTNVTAACNLSVLIDGVSTNAFTNAGQPYNVTVNVTRNGAALAAKVRIKEWNGYSIFAMPQYQVSNVTNYVYGDVNVNGIVSVTAVPTGGWAVSNTAVGYYNITIDAIDSDVVCDSKNISVINRTLEEAGVSAPQVPNLDNIRYFKDRVAVAYINIKDWLANGGGENKNIVIWTNGSPPEGLGFTVIAGKPYGLNITVKNATSLVAGAKVMVTEKNGLPPFILPQYQVSNVTNYAAGETFANANGYAWFTIIPTGGFGVNSAAVGNYNISINVYEGSEHKFNTNLTCIGTDCNFGNTGVGQEIPNIDNVRYFKDKIAIVYIRIKDWLANIGG